MKKSKNDMCINEAIIKRLFYSWDLSHVSGDSIEDHLIGWWVDELLGSRSVSSFSQGIALPLIYKEKRHIDDYLLHGVESFKIYKDKQEEREDYERRRKRYKQTNCIFYFDI